MYPIQSIANQLQHTPPFMGGLIQSLSIKWAREDFHSPNHIGMYFFWVNLSLFFLKEKGQDSNPDIPVSSHVSGCSLFLKEGAPKPGALDPGGQPFSLG